MSSELSEIMLDRPVVSDQPMVKVWDFPTRVFHWGIVACVLASWITIENGWIDAHLVSGMLLFCLLVFRLFWGVIGATTARFVNFVKGPMESLSYLNKSLKLDSKHYTGHNPAGGWMVIVMISILMFQVVTGMLANDEIGFAGPLSDLISKENSDAATRIHALIFDFILLCIWLHLVAVFFYVLVKSDNLVGAMITGKKRADRVCEDDQLTFQHPLRALAVALVSAAIGGLILLL